MYLLNKKIPSQMAYGLLNTIRKDHTQGEGSFMAIDQTINDEDEVTAVPRNGKSRTGRTLLIILVLLMLLGGGAVAALMMIDEETRSGLPVISALLGNGDEARAREARIPPPIYVELGDAFVVNYLEGNQIRYLQVRIEVMTRDPAIPQAIMTHMPRIRNNLVFVLSGMNYAALATVDGKHHMREQVLAEIQSILEEESGSSGIEAVYFTSFVMQ